MNWNVTCLAVFLGFFVGACGKNDDPTYSCTNATLKQCIETTNKQAAQLACTFFGEEPKEEACSKADLVGKCNGGDVTTYYYTSPLNIAESQKAACEEDGEGTWEAP
jgi:hypothetical protein